LDAVLPFSGAVYWFLPAVLAGSQRLCPNRQTNKKGTKPTF
jgi:hypothetical protein